MLFSSLRKRLKNRWDWPVVVCALLVAPKIALADDAGNEFFEKKIRPVLTKHCFECHAKTAKELKAGLRLDTASGIREGGDSGPAVVPGEPDESLLIKAVRYTDQDMQMPPTGKLPDEAIKDLEEWVKQGAPDPREDKDNKDDAAPAAKPAADLEQGRKFWSFQPPRMVQPPAVNDAAWATSDIDRFVLAGLQAKGLAPVADASQGVLLRRVYFDLIGLPPTPEETDAFLADESAEAFERVVDRLLSSPRFGERWGRHWLDVARFAESSGGGRSLLFPDAWRYRDYVIASLNADKPYDQFIREQIAGDLLPATSDQKRADQLVATGFLLLGPINYEEQHKDVLEMDVVDEQLDTLGRVFLGMTIGCARCHDHKFDPIPTKDYYALAGILRSTKTLIHDNVSRWTEQPLPMPVEQLTQVEAHEAQVAAVTQEIAALKKTLKPEGEKIVQVAELPGIAIDDAQAKQVGEWTHSKYTAAYVGDGYLHDNNEQKGKKTVTFVPEIPAAGKYEVRLAYTPGGNRASNVPVTIFHLDGEFNGQVNEKQPPAIDGHFVSLGTFRFEPGSQWFVRVSNSQTDGHVIVDAVQFLPEGTEAGAKVETAELDAAEDETTANAARLKELETQLKSLKEHAPVRPMAMAVVESDRPRDCEICIRGNVKNRGDAVPRGVLQVVSPVAAAMPSTQSGRRELAEWLANKENPLTARVMVNRIWHYLFGTGLVRTVDNFGVAGEAPSHPELLDYLAVQFMRDGNDYPAWSTKRMIRMIVLSHAYRLSSEADARASAVDPENRLLWRMNRRRLEAECLRDAVLSASGRLDLSAGGPTIKPGTSSEYGYAFEESRRSVYLPVFRNRLPEFFEAFDFADPNLVVGRRNVSTVATQSLFLLNSPLMMEQARAAAERLVGETTDIAARLDRAFGLTLGRLPTDAERQTALAGIVAAGADGDAQLKAWQQVFQALFSSIDFRYLR